MTEILTRRETGPGVGPLRNLLDGDAVAPGDAEWDEARLAWNLSVDQQPAAVVLAESAADVAATVAFARAHGAPRRPRAPDTALRRWATCQHDPAEDRAHARCDDRRRETGSPAPRPARSGSRSSKRRPSMASPRSPAPRRTSASSATRSVGALLARPQARPRCQPGDRDRGRDRRRRLVHGRGEQPTCSGRCAAAAALRRGDRDRVRPLPDREVYAGVLWYPPTAPAEVLHVVDARWTRPPGRDDHGRPHPAVPADPRDPRARPRRVVRGRRSALAGGAAQGATRCRRRCARSDPCSTR